jgi:hypothetical protein
MYSYFECAEEYLLLGAYQHVLHRLLQELNTAGCILQGRDQLPQRVVVVRELVLEALKLAIDAFEVASVVLQVANTPLKVVNDALEVANVGLQGRDGMAMASRVDSKAAEVEESSLHDELHPIS